MERRILHHYGTLDTWGLGYMDGSPCNNGRPWPRADHAWLLVDVIHLNEVLGWDRIGLNGTGGRAKGTYFGTKIVS